MAYEKDMLEKIEYLRTKAAVGYEEAARLLERFDGDLTRALVELERGGRMRPEATYSDEGYAYENQAQKDWQYQQPGGHAYGAGPETFKRKASGLVAKLLRNRIVVQKKDTVIANFTLLFCLVCVVLAPWLAMLSVALMFLCGYRVSRKVEGEGMTEYDVEGFVDKTAQNIKRTVTSFTERKAAQTQQPQGEVLRNKAPIAQEPPRPAQYTQPEAPVAQYEAPVAKPEAQRPVPPPAMDPQDDEGGEITIE